MTATSPYIINKKVQEGVLAFHKQTYSMINKQWNIREQMRQIDLAYIREQDQTKEHRQAQISNRLGDQTKLQDVTVPVVMPQVEAAVTYQTSVFLTGSPIFSIVASPQFEDEALQMDTVIDNQATRGGWVRELILAFRDGFKYNLMGLEVDWCRDVTAILETDLSFSPTQAKQKEVIWEGNSIKRMDMYNTYYDTTVKPTEIHTKGDFVGYTEIITRTQLKTFINRLPNIIIENVVSSFESGIVGGIGGTGGIESYYVPSINPTALANVDPRITTDWLAWAAIASQGSSIQYKNIYEKTVLYARIIPSDFGIKVPSSNTPQIWKFIIINHSVVIYAERQTNAHSWLPILIGQPLEDGLGYQTKSLASNASSLQDVSSGLMNSIIAGRRRAATDRVLYDPSRIYEHNINSSNPSAKIPVKPSAYGKDIGQSVYQFPYKDDQLQYTVPVMQMLKQFASDVSGQNPARQGQFVKGNKTKKEFSDVMDNSNGRDQTVSLLLEAQLFTPIKEIIKINILQYQGGVSLFNKDKQKIVNVDPIKLRKAILEFKLSDGLLPSDKLINADVFQVALQVFGSSPQIAAEYNIGPLFSYLMKTQGASLRPFEKSPTQVAYEQAVSKWQELVMQLAKQNIDPAKFPKQPIPQDYGYDPNQQIQPSTETGTQIVTQNKVATQPTNPPITGY